MRWNWPALPASLLTVSCQESLIGPIIYIIYFYVVILKCVRACVRACVRECVCLCQYVYIAYIYMWKSCLYIVSGILFLYVKSKLYVCTVYVR